MNAVASGIAGMKRISSLLKETTESDVGEVTLIRTENSENSKNLDMEVQKAWKNSSLL